MADKVTYQVEADGKGNVEKDGAAHAEHEDLAAEIQPCARDPRGNHEAKTHAKARIDNHMADGHVLQRHGLVERLGKPPEQPQEYEIEEMAGNNHGCSMARA